MACIILLLTLFVVILVISVISIIITYLLLKNENYNWWWQTIFSGSAFGMILFIYRVVLFVFSTQPNILETDPDVSSPFATNMIYFVCSLMFSYVIGLILASVSHWSSHSFVVKIYSGGGPD